MTSSLIIFLLACGGTDPVDSGPADTGTTATDGGAISDGGNTEIPVPGNLDGDWLIGLTIAPVGDIVMPFKAEVSDEVLGDSHSITHISLRATDGADGVSDVLAELTDIDVGADGSFTAEFPTLTLPGEYSPTSGEVDVQATLTVTAATDESFCGDVGGSIETFGIDLAGSTFGAIPWDQRADGVSASCDGDTSKALERLAVEDCPSVVDGVNTNFPSGTVARDFELILPADYDAASSWPVVMAFHGIGGTPGGLLDGDGLRTMADDAQVILVVPQATELGGSIAWDPVSDKDYNIDVVLFDDLLTCVSTSFNVDADNVSVTGMSNGGLLAGKLLSLRGDVLSAAVPLSGGILGTWPDSPKPPPTMVVWGGVDDVAYGQDFNGYADTMLTGLADRDVFAVGCDHGKGHYLDATFWPWVFEFLLDHPRGVDPEPYADGLPDSFPDYCGVSG